jgi:phosphatidylinositol glycan class U
MFDHFRPFFLMVFSVSHGFVPPDQVFIKALARKGSPRDLHLADLHKVSVSMVLCSLFLSSERRTLLRHDALYASFLLVGILGIFKAYLTLADPGLFLSMFVLFPEVYPCMFSSSHSHIPFMPYEC